MHRVRDPLHGFIPVRPLEAALVDTRAFQRLRRVRQLGLTCLVYPGAEHTRFAHALGVMHVAGQLAETLERQGWRGSVDRVRAAALLHDLGHPPLSHAGEKGVRHEHMSVRLVREGEVAAILRAHGQDPEAVAAVLTGDGDPIETELVAGQLDADRMDYLLRDGWACGVSYGTFDLPRIVESVTVADGRVGVRRGGLHAVEGLLLARTSMFLQVYFHRTRRILDLLLEEVLPDWPEEPEAFLDWDDGRFLETLRTSPHPAARAIWDRVLPACVVELEVSAAAAQRAEAEALAELLRAEVGRIWVDSTARVRTFRPDGDVPLVEADGRVTSVLQASPVLRRMDPEVEVRRIYVPRPDAERARALVRGARATGAQLRLF